MENKIHELEMASAKVGELADVMYVLWKAVENRENEQKVMGVISHTVRSMEEIEGCLAGIAEDMDRIYKSTCKKTECINPK